MSMMKYDEETDAEVQKFSWSIISVTTSDIQLKVEFEHPESISTDKDNPHFVQVQAKFSDFEPFWNDDLVLVNVRLPK